MTVIDILTYKPTVCSSEIELFTEVSKKQIYLEFLTMIWYDKL